ncbi:hypothetical protein L3V31_12670 [Vibrio sp. J1-1]|uniref:VPA1269 family protein n=1 Tax=Vibrio sp. J1-1 TaxID=2912251 RepID=UPI001EEDF134|nr:VPA1269 family protein [Vibrio sp. J1-1]MCF7482581.1 hypothetical protein [Vibrio sp. J1-1]
MQKLKGIEFRESVTDYEQATISAMFFQPKFHQGNKARTAHDEGMSTLSRLLKNGKVKLNSLLFYQNVGNNQRFNAAQFVKGRNSNLYKEFAIISDKLNLNGRIQSEDSLKTAEKRFQESVEFLQYLTNTNSIGDITIEMFKQFILPVRTQNNRWHEDTSPHIHKALRSMALCLDDQFNCAEYIKCVEVQRIDTLAKMKDLFSRPDKHMRKWVDSWHEFLDAKNAFSTKGFKDAATKMRDYLEETYASDSCSPFPDEPLLYFAKYRGEEFYNWLNDLVEKGKITSKALINTISALNSYANWFIATYMSDTDENGELVTLGHPLLSSHRLNQIIQAHGAEDNGDIKLSESSKPCPPLWMVLKLKEILTENDYEWAKSLTSQYNDSIVDENGDPVWIPVITFLYLVMLEIPLRKIQVLRLDSGEGDMWRYDAQSDIWAKNDHQLANYWKNTGAKVPNRGAFRRKLINGILKPEFALYVNSNKTADKNVGFGEKSGYEIPWKNPHVIKYLDELRIWQEKYNPAAAPVRYKDIPTTVFEGDPAKKVLASIPDRFYLFRAAKDIKNGNRQMPPTIRMLHEFWVRLMDELEKRLHEEGVDCQIILSRNPKTNAAQQALYSPHGLRLAGLTSLAQQGVPIEILSKIVAGHKSILMTIYYQKFHPNHISEILNEASRDLELQYQKSFQSWLRDASWIQVAEYAAYNSEDAIEGVQSAVARCTASLWSSTNLGLCPYNGTRCHDGGACVRKNGKGRNIHLPIEDKNCVMCRHFITGLPWLTELWVHGNALILKSEKISKDLEELQQEERELKVKRKNLVQDGEEVPSGLRIKITKLQTLHEKKSINLDNIFKELHATHNLVEKVKKLPKAPIFEEGESENNSAPALLMNSDSEFDVDYVEAPNNFQNLDFVIQASRFYKHEKNMDFEREREMFMDEILLRNGYEPLMLMNLTKEEKQQSADAFAKLLVTKVDSEMLQLLKDGRIKLSELGLEKDTLEAFPVNIPKNLIAQSAALPS